MASTELRKRKQEEYEMQLFDFHSRAVFATLKSIVHDQIKYKCQKMCVTIKETYKPDVATLEALKKNEKQLLVAYYTGAVPHVRAIENIVNKHVCIPSNVLLEEDAPQRVQYTCAEFEGIEEKLKNLQQRAKQVAIFNTALHEEMRMIEQYESYENQLNKMLNVIESGMMIPELDSKMSNLVEKYKQFSSEFGNVTSPSLKSKYNNLNYLKCKDCNFKS